MWRLLLGTMGVKSLVQGLNAAATAGFEPRTVWSEVRRRNRLATAPALLALFPRRSKMACPSDEYCFTCICSLVAETGAAHFFLFRSPSKIKRRMVAVAFRSNSTSSSSSTKVGCFVFVSFCFVFCLFSFCLWSLFFFFITCLHDSQTTYTPSSGHKHVKNDTGKQRKRTKRVRFELEASPSLSTYM